MSKRSTVTVGVDAYNTRCDRSSASTHSIDIMVKYTDSLNRSWNKIDRLSAELFVVACRYRISRPCLTTLWEQEEARTARRAQLYWRRHWVDCVLNCWQYSTSFAGSPASSRTTPKTAIRPATGSSSPWWSTASVSGCSRSTTSSEAWSSSCALPTSSRDSRR